MASNKQKTIRKKQPAIDISRVAKLANLPLTKTEEETFEKQLPKIVGYISKLSEVDTQEVEPIAHITGLKNITRKDEAAPGLSQKDATKNAPKVRNGFFEVDAIFEEQ